MAKSPPGYICIYFPPLVSISIYEISKVRSKNVQMKVRRRVWDPRVGRKEGLKKGPKEDQNQGSKLDPK